MSQSNIYDIAKAAGVSPATVSRVLNDNRHVKQSTKEKVLAVIEKTGYRPNALARNLSTGEASTIVFVVPDIDNHFFIKILQGITDVAMDCGYNVCMYDTGEDAEREKKVLSSLSAELIKGLIVIPVLEENLDTKEQLTLFEKRGVPVVLLDRDISGSEFDGVFSDDINDSLQAVECLIAEGHRNIATITGPLTTRPGRERYEGYKRALEKFDIPRNPDYVVNGSFQLQEAYEAMEKLMQVTPRPTAIFTTSNMTTLGCLRYMKDHGIRMCHDISIVGFDDVHLLLDVDMMQTVMSRSEYMLGSEAMRLLNLRFAEGILPEIERGIVRRHTVKTQLVKRGSEKFHSFEKSEA